MSTWIYAIARNTALTWLRSESYRRTEPLDAGREFPSPTTNSVDSCGIRACVALLPPDQREIVEQYYFHDRSIEDVAEVLGLAPGTVKSHLFRARRALAAMLGERE
jgi:RNA polymerase sigma factor (sigma-70 family)